MQRETEHPSSTHKYGTKLISTFIGQNKESFFMHVLKKDVLLLCAKLAHEKK